MSVEVVRPGLQTTVQDTGRLGFRSVGVSICGALDEFACRVSNMLVGNAHDAAILEVTLAGCSLKFASDALIAICGGDLSPMIEDRLVPNWRPTWVEAGGALDFRESMAGCRAYLAVAGGFDVPTVLGSRSTDLRAGFGGHEGRALQTGDILPLGTRSDAATKMLDSLKASCASLPWAAPPWFVSTYARPRYTTRPTLRILRGGEFESFTLACRRALFERELVVAAEANRMGYRLRGFNFKIKRERELLSSAVAPGTIQVPPGGDPMLLLADCQTTGGYPIIAHVIRADLPLVAQTKPGDSLRFIEITLAEAHRLDIERAQALLKIERAVRLKLF